MSSNRGKILIVENDEDMMATLSAILEKVNFETFKAQNGREAHALFSSNPIDLLLLDLNLETEDGMDIAREIRSNSTVPIVILSGRTEVVDKVVGLEIGADDYVTKPFNSRELIARLQRAIRRYKLTKTSNAAEADDDSHIFRFDTWTLNLVSATLTNDDGQVNQLTTYENKVLGVLVQHPRKALSRTHILTSAADRDWNPYDRSLDVLIGKIRRKLNDDPRKPKYIRTVRNFGYMFTETLKKPAN